MTPEQAMAQAQAALAANQQAVTPAATSAQAVIPAAPQWAAPTIESLMNQSFSVDAFIKITDAGIALKKDCSPKETLEKVRLVIDTQIERGYRLLWSMSYGNPAQYIESYDGRTTIKGEDFGQSVQRALAADAKAKPPFQTAKVGCILLDDGAHGHKAGAKLGLTFTRTGVAPWTDLLREVAQRGLTGQKVEVILGYRVGQMKGMRDWGIPTFELVGEYFEGGGE